MNTTFDHQKRSPNKSMSSSKQQVTRVFGQRSIPSTFLSRSSIRPIHGGEGLKKGKAPARESPVTLSDFLNRKLQKGSVLPKFVQGKRRPFSSPATGVVASGSNEGQNNGNKSDSKCGLDIAFEQLKHTRKENSASVCFPADGEVESSTIQDTQGSRKRRNSSEVGDGTQSARKVLVTLGENPQSARKAINNSFISNEKPMPQYNHYANGSGWWDSNMEGVDNEEVGCHEVWEGVGSTTLGGLEWH